MPRIAQITSTGRYIPERVMTNADLDQMLGENVGDWLVENVGIEERHIMAEDETTASMLIAASEQAIERAGLTAEDIDLIIVATDTPDYISPATSSIVQAKLGASNAGTYDINAACSGLAFLNAWVAAPPNSFTS